MVAEAFVPNPLNRPQVNHINNIKGDNRSENLEWVTLIENVRHSFMVLPVSMRNIAKGERNSHAKVTAADVISMRELRKRGVPTSEIAHRYGLKPSSAYYAITGRSWKHL